MPREAEAVVMEFHQHKLRCPDTGHHCKFLACVSEILQGDDLPLRGRLLQHAWSICGHGRNLGRHLLGVGLRGCESSPKLVPQELVLRLGGLSQLAEFSHLPRGFARGALRPAFCWPFAPIVVEFFVLGHGPVCEISVLQRLHEDDVLLILHMDLLNGRRSLPCGGCNLAGGKRQGRRFLEDGFQGSADRGSPRTGSCCSGHLGPGFNVRLVSPGPWWLASIASFIHPYSNGRALMTTAHWKRMARWSFQGLDYPIPATCEGTLWGGRPP
eukprot:3203200-Amphidinium_carterae.2